MIPSRNVFGNLTFRSLTGAARREAAAFETAYSMAFNAFVFWMDGTRSAFDVYRRVVQEREAVSLRAYHAFCLFLEANGFISVSARSSD